MLSVDPIESAMIRAGIEPSHETGLAAYLIVQSLADEFLASGVSPVVDGVNAVDAARDTWRRLAAKHDVQLVLIECIATDADVHAGRLEGRRRGLDLAEPTWEAVTARRAEWTPWREERLVLDAVDPLDTNVLRALGYLNDRTTQFG